MVARADSFSRTIANSFRAVDCGPGTDADGKRALRYEKGAFTARLKQKPTLQAAMAARFLGRNWRLRLEMQAKLCALQERKVRPVGSNDHVTVERGVSPATTATSNRLSTASPFRKVFISG